MPNVGCAKGLCVRCYNRKKVGAPLDRPPMAKRSGEVVAVPLYCTKRQEALWKGAAATRGLPLADWAALGLDDAARGTAYWVAPERVEWAVGETRIPARVMRLLLELASVVCSDCGEETTDLGGHADDCELAAVLRAHGALDGGGRHAKSRGTGP